MTPAQMVGWSLNQATAITAIVSTRIYHGKRPDASITPCINYFEMTTKRKNGFESATYSFNCRASTVGTAIQIARLVDDLFNGTSGTGIYGSMNGFEISRASEVQMQSAIYETTENIWNAPVDILFIYPMSSVS